MRQAGDGLAEGSARIEPVLRITGLSKQFGGVRALDDVAFEVARREVHGLLGQNGSDGQQGNGTDAKLQIPPLEAGFYYLVVDGPAGMLRMDFAPPAAQQALQ